MLFEAEDLIYRSSDDSDDSVVKTVNRFGVKYAAFFDEEENTPLRIDIRADFRCKETLEKQADCEAHNILKQIDEVRKESGASEVCVRHCYTPDGQGYYAVFNGYYAVYDAEGKCRRFVKSMYNLILFGGCWSYFAWRKLLAADTLLVWYLEQVKQNIQKQTENVKMEIRHLYLPYIIRRIDSEEMPLLQIQENANAAIEEYIKLHSKEYEEYSACKEKYTGEKALNWYNGAENSGFYTVTEILGKAVNDIYAHENELKACGMWEKAYAVKKLLVDMRCECGDFIQLRQYDNPVQELLRFAEREVHSYLDINTAKVLEFATRKADKVINHAHVLKWRYCVELLTGVICYVLENGMYRYKDMQSVSSVLNALANTDIANADNAEDEVNKLMQWCNDKAHRYYGSTQHLMGLEGKNGAFQMLNSKNRMKLAGALEAVLKQEG